ncbi:MAG TPA: hypothetical protein VMY76_03875 [Gemmatimonadales bacterium]|nr:hypothetical protein [Gemmatimonadales bacterium]
MAAAALALALAACGKESGPSEFNPQGTSADVAAAQGAFASEQTSSFAAVSADISTALSGSPVVASSAAMALTKLSGTSARYARQLASLVPKAGRGLQASASAMPSALLGTTFVWDEANDEYVPSDESGAPSSGVRFVLYAVDPVLLRPVEPVVEVGYVDVIDQSTETTVDVRVKVVEGNVVYLDYDVTAIATAVGGVVTVDGYASNGSTVANFTLKNTISQNDSGLVMSLDYDLTVPSRDVAVNWTATFANISENEVVVTLDLSISGSNGAVRLLGTYGANGGSFTVKVNGDPFATVTLNGGNADITGAGGEPLTADEEASLQAILSYFDTSLGVFTELMLPIV